MDDGNISCLPDPRKFKRTQMVQAVRIAEGAYVTKVG